VQDIFSCEAQSRSYAQVSFKEIVTTVDKTAISKNQNHLGMVTMSLIYLKTGSNNQNLEAIESWNRFQQFIVNDSVLVTDPRESSRWADTTSLMHALYPIDHRIKQKWLQSFTDTRSGVNFKVELSYSSDSLF